MTSMHRRTSADPLRPDERPVVILDRETAEQVARTLRAVSDPTRLQILSMVLGSAAGRVTVGEIARQLGLRQPTVTHHLKIMAEHGVLEREPEGRIVWHRIHPDRYDEIVDLLR